MTNALFGAAIAWPLWDSWRIPQRLRDAEGKLDMALYNIEDIAIAIGSFMDDARIIEARLAQLEGP